MSIKTLRGSVLELISFIRLIDRKDIPSVKVVWLVLKFWAQTFALFHLEGNSREHEMNEQTHSNAHIKKYTHIISLKP